MGKSNKYHGNDIFYYSITSYGLYFFSWEIKSSLKPVLTSSSLSTCISTPWEAVETGGWHGVQTNALVHRRTHSPPLEVPFHSEERLCRTVSHESKATGSLGIIVTVKGLPWRKNVSPVFFLPKDSLVSSPVKGGDLKIICRCDIKSVYVQN